MEELDKAYIAGIVDGEGCITITKSIGRGHELVLQIAMTNKPTLEYISSITGTTVRTGGTQTFRKKPLYQIGWSGPKAQAIIRNIQPYLICKGGQAELALLFPNRKHGGRNGCVPPDIIDMREELMQEIKSLNK